MCGFRIFFATDLHGSERCFLKFLNASKMYSASVVIVGGDITGKLIVPITQNRQGSYIARFQGVDRVLNSKEELETFEKMVRDTGSYTYHTTTDEVTRLNEDKVCLSALFTKLMHDRVKDWIRIAEERLRGTNIQCFITPGNDDDFAVDDAFKGSEFVVNPESIVVDLPEGFQMISSGFSNITPWRCPRDVCEEELGKKIQNMVSQVRDFKQCIFNFHCPPFGTHLDLAPRLDKDLRPVLGMGGTPEMIHVGSISIKEAIEKFCPVLSLHGHIHESRASQKIGQTLAVNPGSEYSEGILRGVLVNLDSGKGVKGYLLTSG